MGKIEGIKIEHYGSLESITLGKIYSDQSGKVLGNMVAIIGPSGTGKSTIADAFGFIADCIENDVEIACDKNNRGGFDQLVSQGTDDHIGFEIYYRDRPNTKPITYVFTIEKDKTGRPYVKEERLRQRVEKYGRPLTFLYLHAGDGYAYEGIDSGTDEDMNEMYGEKERVDVHLTDKRKLGIVTYGTMKQYPRIERFLSFLKSWYLCYFSPDSARQIQFAAPQAYLDRTGSNLNNVAQYMYREDKLGFEKILSEIQTKLPGISKIIPERMANGQIVLKFLENGFTESFYSPRMSDGTLKLFAYYLLLHERTPRQLVFIEEPENGLYHQYLANLAIEMRSNVGTGYSKQLFITTHSPFFVNAMKPEDVWVLEKGANGYSTAKRASDYEYVKEMVKEDVSLGDLWYSNYFG